MRTRFLGRWTWLLALAFALCLGPGAKAEIVAAWLFNEGSGTSVGDSSGNGLTGTIRGSTQWQTGTDAKFGAALRFTDGSYVDFGAPTPPALLIERDISFAAWIRPQQVVSHWQVVFSMQRGSSGGEAYALTYGNGDDQLRAIVNTAGGNAEPFDPQPFVWGEWIHAAATYDGGTVLLYRNGQPVAQDSSSVSGALNHEDGTGRFAINGNFNSLNGGLAEHAVCTLDELVLLDEVLSQERIQALMSLGFLDWRSGPGLAKDPIPEDKATDAPSDVTLAWTAGEFAATHDVYFGTAFADVNDASRANAMGVLVSQGQSDATYASADPLAFGQTYFWRIDEVNAAPDGTIYQGKTWSFTTEPYAYPVTSVTATASSAQAGMGPENTINRAGLNASDQHGTELTTMWMSAGVQPNWIQYEFDGVYKLDSLLVWNSNQLIEPFIGFGARDVSIEYSVDGATWTALEGVPEFARGPGSPTYTANTTVDFGGVLARYVKLTVNQTWGGAAPQASLSEVRFFHVPLAARAPEPAVAATGVSVDTDLSWRPGREASSHTVYLGTEEAAVAAGSVASETVTEHSYTPASLDYGTTYFWKVDEVGDAGAYPGPLWSFTTEEYAVVDDFESYNDDDRRIYDSWIDGLTDQAKGGSQVGYDVSPFAEKTTVHGGSQAMPLSYNNTGVTISEAQLTFPAQDWTARGLQSLALFFYGAADNTGKLYLKINNTKIPYDGDAADIAGRHWQAWNIDLSAVGGNLKNVTSLTIGVEGSAAAGLLFIDDIRLYPRVPQVLTPVDPGKNGLLAEYTFDSNANDSSGQGHHGTFVENAHVADGRLVLDGTNDSITIPRLGGADATFYRCTYSMWMYSLTTPASSGFIGGINFHSWSAGGIHCKLSDGRANAGIYALAGGDLQGTTVAGPEEWVHLALTVSDTVATIYLNGQVEASRSFPAPLAMTLGNASLGAWNNNGDVQRELKGMMDDVRIYDRAVSPAELLWLAGKRAPVHQPF